MDAYETVIQELDDLREIRVKRVIGYAVYKNRQHDILQGFYQAHMLELLQYQEAQQAVGDMLGCEGTD